MLYILLVDKWNHEDLKILEKKTQKTGQVTKKLDKWNHEKDLRYLKKTQGLDKWPDNSQTSFFNFILFYYVLHQLSYLSRGN